MNCNVETRRHDNDLASLAANGDAAAFEEIHSRHRRLVYSVALRMTGNRADAEDLTQETFLSLLRGINGFRGDAAFVSWLYRLTVNQVLMHFRRRRSRPEDQTTNGQLPEPVRGGAWASDPLSATDRIAVRAAVRALPPGYRTTVILHDVEGYGHGEIARLTGRRPGTSKSQLHKARARLRRMLSGTPPALVA